MLTFLLSVTVYKFLINYELQQSKKYYCTILILLTIIALISFSVDFIYEKNVADFGTFKEYNIERAQYMDYPRPSYIEARNIYQSIGWDEDLYNLVGKWFFLDKNVNGDTFKIINTYTKTQWERYGSRSLKSTMIDIYIYTKNVLYAYIPARAIYMSILILTGLNIFFYMKDIKLNKFNILMILGCFIWLHIAIIYLSYTGRMLLRVFILISLPIFVTMFFNVISSLDRLQFKFKKIIISLLVMLSLFLGLQTLGSTIKIANNEIYTNSSKSRNILEKYAMDNSENLYIYDYPLALSGDPWIVYPDKKPTNYYFWGGSTMFSPHDNERIRKNGLTDLYADKFLENNCYYLTIGKPNSHLVSYMKNKYNIKDVIIVDKVDVATVYKFIQ